MKNKRKVPSLYIYKEVIYVIFKYNASPLDYFSFRFYELTPAEREDISGTGFMYEYQLVMNPKSCRKVLNDKILFLTYFQNLIGRKWSTLSMLTENPALFYDLFENTNKKVIIKSSKGQAGKQVDLIDLEGKTLNYLFDIMRRKHYDLIEEYVFQHSALMALSPSGLNTIRVVTQYFKNEVLVLFAFLRVSVNSFIDNLSADNYSRNFGCAIDLQTGKVNKPGTYLNSTKPYVYNHPVTNVAVMGFQIPHWEKCLALIIEAARMVPENRSIGWDVAITDKGPLLIEANHNWNNLSLVPGRKGYKQDFLRYLKHKEV